MRRQLASLAVLVALVGAVALARATGASDASVALPSRAQRTGEGPAVAPASDDRWIDAWAVSYTPTTVNGTLQSSRIFENQTLRLNVFAKLGGARARVKFTNRYTNVPLAIGGAHVALRSTGASIDPATDRTITFGGQATDDDPGRRGRCGATRSRWRSGSTPTWPSASSSRVPTGRTGFHRTGLKTSYIGPGDQTGAASISVRRTPGGTRRP